MSSATIPKHGGYRKLKSFQVAQLTYDVTVQLSHRAYLVTHSMAWDSPKITLTSTNNSMR